MSLHTRVSGAWKTVNTVYVKVSGAWKTCRQVYVRQGGVWKKCLQNTSTTTINGPGLGGTVSISNVTSGTTITVSGTFNAPMAENDDGIPSTPVLAAVFTGCSSNRADKNYNGGQTANFSFSTTANSSNVSVQLGSYHTRHVHWCNEGSLSNVKISYTTTGYFD